MYISQKIKQKHHFNYDGRGQRMFTLGKSQLKVYKIRVWTRNSSFIVCWPKKGSAPPPSYTFSI